MKIEATQLNLNFKYAMNNFLAYACFKYCMRFQTSNLTQYPVFYLATLNSNICNTYCPQSFSFSKMCYYFLRKRVESFKKLMGRRFGKVFKCD